MELTEDSPAQILARFGHALSDPTRARLLLALRRGPGYPAELADLLGVSRTNLSNHLACLRGCGLVVTAAEGRRTRYELADDRLAHALDDLIGVVLAVDPEHGHAASVGGAATDAHAVSVGGAATGHAATDAHVAAVGGAAIGHAASVEAGV